MQHEILLALCGCPGDIFIKSKDNGFYELIPDVPFIHPSEVYIVNRIVLLGNYYLNLQEFIKHQTSSVVTLTTPSINEGSFRQGLYIKALAFGLNTVLELYRQRIVEVEKECIADPHLPLSHVKQRFEEFHFLLPSLDSTVKHINSNKLHGCSILSMLYDKTVCGVPLVKKTYESLLHTCHGVLFKQLASWMIHGQLSDDYDEFFIIPLSKETEEKNKNGSTDKKNEGFSGYQIDHYQLSVYIPIRVAEKILFIGEALQIFTGKESERFFKLSLKQGKQTSQSANQLHSHQLTFSSLLTNLQQKPSFDLRAFESCCSEIRDTVAEHLWSLLVEEADLIGSLQTMKEFFLLGRGSLFLTFIDIANSFMSLPPSQATQHDVNVAFRQAMSKLSIEDDTLLEQLLLTVPAPPSSRILPTPVQQQKTGVTKLENGWDQLGLKFDPKWPLHILFTQSVLEKYNTLFKILLAIRRAQVALQHCWYLQMSKRKRSTGLLWQLRIHLSFFIDNLQYYVQVDVLETQFSILLDKIKSTHDFESIRHAHDVYLSTLLTQVFSTLTPVWKGLNDIINLCHQFHALVQTVSDPVTAKENNQLERISKDFNRQASLLFRILSNVRSYHSSPHLAQLLLRIDYNQYFTTHTSSLIVYPTSN